MREGYMVSRLQHHMQCQQPGCIVWLSLSLFVSVSLSLYLSLSISLSLSLSVASLDVCYAQCHVIVRIDCLQLRLRAGYGWCESQRCALGAMLLLSRCVSDGVEANDLLRSMPRPGSNVVNLVSPWFAEIRQGMSLSPTKRPELLCPTEHRHEVIGHVVAIGQEQKARPKSNFDGCPGRCPASKTSVWRLNFGKQACQCGHP